MSTRLFDLAIGLALALLVGGVYAQTSDFGFLPLDDPGYVVDNPNVSTGLTLENAGWAFTTRSHGGNWHPLTSLSHMLDVELFGLRPGPHHTVNVAFHALNAVLLFLALQLLTGARWRSAMAAGLFAVHPLHVESVAWISERKDVLSAAFFFATLIFWVRHARRPGTGRYAAVFVGLALGLMAKPMLVTLPFVLLLLDFWPLQRWPERSWRALAIEKLPLMGLSALFSLATLSAQTHVGALAVGDELDAAWRVVQAPLSCLTYLLRAVWPLDLAVFHPHPALVAPESFSRLAWLSLGASLLLLAALGGAFLQRRRAPWLLVGALWFLGMLVPVIGFVQVGDQAWADRYTYLPLIGIYVAAIWSAAVVVERLAATRPGARAIAAALCALLLGAAAWRAHAQVALWRDGRTLFEHTLQVTEHNYLVHFALGKVQQDAGESAAARVSYERALAIRPKMTRALQNLGGLLLDTDPVQAERHFGRFVEIDPGNPEAHFHLGLALARQQRAREALAAFEQAVRTDPGHAGANSAVGLVWMENGQLERARPYLERAEQRRPSVETFNNMGLLLWQLGDLTGAVARFETALRYAPDNPQVIQNLRAVRAQQRGGG